MPIRPEERGRYPADWPEISRRIREDRAGGRCECTGECGADHTRDGDDARCAALHGEPHPITTSPVVLTVGHLDRIPEHSADHELRAWCQDCHLAYDIHDHVAQAQWTRSLRRVAASNNRELFPSPLGHDAPRRAPEPVLEHVWRLRINLAERHGNPCRVLARGKLNSVLVEFADGARHVVSRWAVRRRQITAPPARRQIEVEL